MLVEKYIYFNNNFFLNYTLFNNITIENLHFSERILLK